MIKKASVIVVALSISILTSSCTKHIVMKKNITTRIKNAKLLNPRETAKPNKQVENFPKTASTHSNFYAPFMYPSLKTNESIHLGAIKIKKLNMPKGEVKISVENMPLNEFVNFVFGKIFDVNYFVGKNVQKRSDRVTLKMTTPTSYSKAFKNVCNILSYYGVSVQEKGNIFYITTSPKAGKKSLTPFIIGRHIPSNIIDNELVTAIVPLNYIRAPYYINFIKDFALSRRAKIRVIPNTNSLIITDTASHLREAMKVIEIFDRAEFERKRVAVIRLSYIQPKEFIDKLDKILPLEGIPVTNVKWKPGIILIPLSEINSVIVASPKQEWINVVLFWKNKLDTVMALGSQPRFFVFYPRNRRAKDLYDIFSKAGSILLSKKKKQETFKIILDNDRNALIVFAPPETYEQLKKVLEDLDTLPKEVLVQVTIAEVTLTNNLQYGIEWYLKHSGRYNGVLQTLGGLGLGSAGLNYSLVTNTKKFQALLNAFARKNLINILSSPRLVVLDNHEATINVGTQVPIVTSEANTSNIQEQGTTSLLRTIQYRNTGVILDIKPTINSNGILTLTIHQEVSQPQVNNTSKIDSPLILNRDINTTVVLKSGSTLLLGGLIQKNKSITVNKVPILGDIPILGNLFKTTSKGTTKTELIIEITPYIISNMSEANEQREKFESLIKWFKLENER